MRLTKYGHAAVVLERDDTSILIDPGAFTPERADLLASADAVLITHEHFDHFDAPAVTAALRAHPSLHAYGPASLTESFDGLADRWTPVAAGDAFTVGPFSVRVFGTTHARIHPDVPLIANVGYLVDNTVFHPGDAYLVPEEPVDTLLMPTSGPWASVAEAVDYVRAVGAKQGIPIHEALLSETGQELVNKFLGSDGLGGMPMRVVAAGSSIEL